MPTKPDWPFWKQLARAEIWECVALSCDADPQFHSEHDLNRMGNRSHRQRLQIANSHYKELQDPENRFQPLPGDKIPIEIFCKWAQRPPRNWPLPQGMRDAFLEPVVDWEAAYKELLADHETVATQRDDLLAQVKELSDEPLETRSKKSALKMILGMSWAVDVKNERDTAGEIVRLVQLTGLTIDIDTVRKWLAEAEALAPTKAPKP